MSDITSEKVADDLVRPTVDEAIAAATAAAFEVTDPESQDFGRKILHCLSGFGADWDLDAVIEAIRTASDIAWLDHFLDHDLAVLNDEGRLRCFAVKRPEAAQAETDGAA